MKPKDICKELHEAGILSLYGGVSGLIPPAPWLVALLLLLDKAQDAQEQETP